MKFLEERKTSNSTAYLIQNLTPLEFGRGVQKITKRQFLSLTTFNMESRDTCIFYRSMYEAIRELPKDVQAEVYNAIFEFSLDFKEPQLSGLSKTIWTLIRPVLEKGNTNYMNGSKAKSKRIRSETEATSKRTRSESEAYKDKDKDKDVDKDKEKVYISTFKKWTKEQFKKEVDTYFGKFPNHILKNFFEYWTEPTPSGKLRLNLEKAWDTNRRLKTWASKEFNQPKNEKPTFTRASQGVHLS